jgi:teichuronic acid exporter
MQAEFKQRSVSAVAWSAGEAFSRQGVQLIIQIVLARLLAPELFGVIAMLSLFIGLAGCFCEGGFSSALIQKQELSAEDTSSVFYFNVLMGIGAALLFWVAASWIAAFYHTPVLRPLTRLMGLNVLIGTLGAVHQALLVKDLDFRCLMRISLVSATISGTIAITLAWRGWGVWSLAIQTLISTGVSTALLWWWRPWRPALAFRLKALRSLFRFGSYLFLSGVLDLAYTRAYSLIIGRFYSAGDLGLYSRADATQQMPASLLSSVVTRVSFPMFAAVSHDRELLRRALRKVLASIMLLNVPAMVGMMVVARPLILTTFGPNWGGCVPYLQILCLAGTLWPLHVLNLTALNALGRSELFFRLEVIKKAIGICIVVGTCLISIRAMAWGMVFFSIVAVVINTHYTGVILDYPLKGQLRDVFPCALPAGAMVACVWPFSLLSATSPAALLGLQISVGCIVYLALCMVLRIESFQYALRELKLGLRASRVSPRPQPLEL